MNRTAVAVIAALALAGCAAPAAAPGPAPTVTVTVTAEAAPTPTLDAATAVAMQMVWNDMDSETQEGMCMVFDLDEDMAWDAFASGDPDFLTRDEFVAFFEEHCA